jgi:hypothetical protein
MRRHHPDMMPDAFHRVQVWTVPWQGNQMEAIAVARQPLLDLRSPVVSGIVLNQEHFPAWVALAQTAEKPRVGLTVEDLASAIVKPRLVQVHGPKDFLRVPLAGRGNQRLAASP